MLVALASAGVAFVVMGMRRRGGGQQAIMVADASARPEATTKLPRVDSQAPRDDAFSLDDRQHGS